MIISFLSDNTSGADERIIAAMAAANGGSELSYGYDKYTLEAAELFKQEFGEKSLFFPVLTGTGANVISLASFLKPYQTVLCAETAHINADECGAVERFSQSRITTVKTPDGKITPAMLMPFMEGLGFEHHSQPGAVSISQTTETGMVYSENELKDLSLFCRKHGLILHIDGSRIANAAVFLGCSLAGACAGADILSFGGTKNGMVMGEAVVFLNPSLGADTKYIRKQYGQLFSKMRFISAQFIPYLKEGIWKENAEKANRAAEKLSGGLKAKGIDIKYPVQGNAVFAVFSESLTEKLSAEFRFYLWNRSENLCRLMCPYDIGDDVIEKFLNLVS